MITEKTFASFGDSMPPPARKPMPEGAYLVRETRVDPNATWWQRLWGDHTASRWVPLKVGADGYLYGDFEAATDWA